jgi:hypothetical protein
MCDQRITRYARFLGSHRGLPLHLYDHTTSGPRFLCKKHTPRPPLGIYSPTPTRSPKACAYKSDWRGVPCSFVKSTGRSIASKIAVLTAISRCIGAGSKAICLLAPFMEPPSISAMDLLVASPQRDRSPASPSKSTNNSASLSHCLNHRLNHPTPPNLRGNRA